MSVPLPMAEAATARHVIALWGSVLSLVISCPTLLKPLSRRRILR